MSIPEVFHELCRRLAVSGLTYLNVEPGATRDAIYDCIQRYRIDAPEEYTPAIGKDHY
jgi:hypothetical protein